MPLTWIPDPATVPWHDVQADEVWTEGPITAVDPEALLTVVGYSCEIVGPEPLEGLVVDAGAAGVTLSAPNTLAHVFPPVEIEYQIQGVTGFCANFDELPEEADEVIRYIPNPANTKDWTIRVSAKCSDGSTHTGDFVLRVWANFDPGRDQLKEAVNARRR